MVYVFVFYPKRDNEEEMCVGNRGEHEHIFEKMKITLKYIV
jgi:hypothetical protein